MRHVRGKHSVVLVAEISLDQTTIKSNLYCCIGKYNTMSSLKTESKVRNQFINYY